MFSHTLSDESFGINYSKFQTDEWTTSEAIVTNLFNYSTWSLSTLAGGIIGSQIAINTLIMNYALIAMFLCMMVLQFVSKEHVIAGGVSVVLSVLFTIILKHNIALVLATVIASFVGYYLEKRKLEKEVISND